MTKFLVVCGVAVLALTLPAAAQTSKKKIRVSKEQTASWLPSFSLAYSSVTDMNDQNRDRVLAHSLGLSAAWKLSARMSASLVSGIAYTSVNNEIEKESRSSMSDTFAGLGYRIPLNSRHRLDIQGGVFFPTSEATQYEGQRGRYLALARINTKVTRWYSVSNKVSGHYIANTYDYSPTTDELNRKTMADYSLDNIFSRGYFFASFGLGARVSTFMDDISELSYFNITKAGVRAGKFAGYLAYMNGSYRDDQRLQPLFFDRYKKMVELAMVYEF